MTSSTSRCSAASRRRAEAAGVTVDRAGSGEVRPDPAEADRRLGRGLEAGRAADRPDRRDGHAGARSRRLPTRASRSCWSTPPWTTRRSPSPRSPRTTRAAATRHSTRSKQLNPERRQGSGHLGRPRHLDHRRPRSRASRTPSPPTDAFTYLGVQYSHNEPATAAQLVTAALQKDPDIVGIFATNLFAAEGSATGVKQAGKEGPGHDRRLRRRTRPGQGAQGGHRPGPRRPAAGHDR